MPPRYAAGVSLRLNLAALTEGELLALLGPDEAQRRLPEISRARLSGQPVLVGDLPARLPVALTTVPDRVWGATPGQSRALNALNAELLGLGLREVVPLPAAEGLAGRGGAGPGLPEEGRTVDPAVLVTQRPAPYLWMSPQVYARAYVLGPVAAALLWSERPGEPNVWLPGHHRPSVRLLTWLRDRASGLACVLTTDAVAVLTPAPSEEIDLHVHPGLGVAGLLARHQQHVQRLGRPQKPLPDDGWERAWQAAHDLNLAAWRRRGVVIET